MKVTSTERSHAIATLSALEKALRLASIGLHVFPCQPENKRPYAGTRGFLDATTDPETIATWFSLDHPEALVAVWAGASGLVVADVDTKNGKDGFRALANAGLTLNPTFSYPTRTGGEHWIYASTAPSGPTQDQPVEGLDRRGGGSYFLWWADEVPADRSVFSADVPAWLAETKPRVQYDGFSGSVKAWIECLPEGDPTAKVRDFIADIPTEDFGHAEMVKSVFRVVRLGAENHAGVPQAIEALYSAWTRPPYESYGEDLKVALEGAIRKAGKAEKRVPQLLRMIDVANVVPPELLDLVLAKPGYGSSPVAHRQRIMLASREAGLSDSQALTLVWGSVAGQVDQLNMDVDAMWREVSAVASNSASASASSASSAISPGTPTTPATRTRASERAKVGYSLLTDTERQQVLNTDWWGERYLEWVKPKLDYYNAPFHRLGRWAVLSSIVAPWGFAAIKGSRPTNCALYMAIPAPSTVGKTDALGFVETVIDAFYGKIEGPNLGTLGKLTSNALHRAILVRDQQASFVYTDEAQSFLRDIQDSKWQGSLLGDLAEYYGNGSVGAKQMMNDREFSGVRGETFLTLYMTGIDDQMTDAMDLSMWTSGLFYRFIWALADPRQPSRDEEQADPTFAGDNDPMPTQFADEFRNAQRLNERFGFRRVVGWDSDAWERYNTFRRQLEKETSDHPRFERVIEPALTRFSKSIIKCATLMALVEGSQNVTMRHALVAIEQAEEWLTGLVSMIDRTSESKFDRDVEELFTWLCEKPRQEAQVYQNFKPAEKVDRIFKQLEREKRIRRDGSEVVQVIA